MYTLVYSHSTYSSESTVALLLFSRALDTQSQHGTLTNTTHPSDIMYCHISSAGCCGDMLLETAWLLWSGSVSLFLAFCVTGRSDVIELIHPNIASCSSCKSTIVISLLSICTLYCSFCVFLSTSYIVIPSYSSIETCSTVFSNLKKYINTHYVYLYIGSICVIA